MASTLEKLLSIQGAIEQQSMEQLMEAPQGAQEPAEDQQREKPHPAAGNAQKGPSAAQESAPPPPGSKPPPEMLEAWRKAFKLFTKYSPALKAAAAQDGPENEEAGRLFLETLEEMRAIWEIGGDAEPLALRVYDMLDDVWHKARAEAEKRSDTMKNDQKGP